MKPYIFAALMLILPLSTLGAQHQCITQKDTLLAYTLLRDTEFAQVIEILAQHPKAQTPCVKDILWIHAMLTIEEKNTLMLLNHTAKQYECDPLHILAALFSIVRT